MDIKMFFRIEKTSQAVEERCDSVLELNRNVLRCRERVMSDLRKLTWEVLCHFRFYMIFAIM
jgi:hypothetical protein